MSPLLARLHAFFLPVLIDQSVAPHDAWLSFNELPLKWHYPLGLLYDLFSGAVPAGLDNVAAGTASQSTLQERAPLNHTADTDTLPWRLTLHYSDYPADLIFRLDPAGDVLRDAFINAVKEADFVRNGTAKAAMSLSQADASALWRSVLHHDLPLFNSVHSKLLDPPGVPLRHVPIKIYLPINLPAQDAPAPIKEEDTEQRSEETPQHAGSVRVVQGLVPPVSAARQQTTLGVALNTLIPTVFPSRRNPVFASPVLHGAVVPMGASLEELGRAASYTDGFLHVSVVLLS